MHELLAPFPVRVEIPVAWGEQDAFGHVNAIVYFRYFETARIAYLEKVQFWDQIAETGLGPIVASASCRFRIPLTYPDTVTSAARVKSIDGEDRFTMEHVIFSHAHRKIAAEGSCLLVTYDHNAKRKIPLPEALHRAISELEGPVL